MEPSRPLEGTTVAAVTFDNSSVIGGLAAIVRLGPEGLTVLRRDAALKMAITGEASSGNRPLRYGSPDTYRYRGPTTRMGIVWLLRRRLLEVKEGDAPPEPRTGAPPPFRPRPTAPSPSPSASHPTPSRAATSSRWISATAANDQGDATEEISSAFRRVQIHDWVE